jgi:hypothetical protein
MSWRATSWAAEQVTGSPITKLVLLKLADNANDEGVCWPSVPLIAEHTELSERTVQDHLRRLEGLGKIVIERRMAGGVNLPNVYHLAMPAATRRKGVVQDLHHGGGAAAAPPVQPAHGVVQDTREVVQETARHIEEPPIEPSKNRHSPAPAGASERWKEFRAAVVETWPGKFPSDDEAKARKAFERALETVEADTLIACARVHGAAKTAQKAKRTAPGEFMMKLPSNWLKECGFQGYADDAAAEAAAEGEIALALGRAHSTMGAEMMEIFRRIEMTDAEVAKLAGASFLGGSQPYFTVVTPFQGALLRRHAAKLQRELGTDELVIVLTGSERRTA